MSDNIEVTIDIHQAELDLEPEELEAYSYHLIGELDELSESAYLMRSSQVPDGGKGNGLDLWIGSDIHTKLITVDEQTNDHIVQPD
ncbi:MAG: hypothetical protein KME43_14765 [Myxacorys chilensis ATA2-1-KO14]|jgi:hypothetical protein|nr:hypothetical protein [Myxacorys chilensis ATA2-1-KO14]